MLISKSIDSGLFVRDRKRDWLFIKLRRPYSFGRASNGLIHWFNSEASTESQNRIFAPVEVRRRNESSFQPEPKAAPDVLLM